MVAETYVPRRISEIDFKSDRKISLVGYVSETRPDGDFVLNDGSGSIEIVNDNRLDFIKTNAKIRVLSTNFDGKVKADIVQDLKNADLSLYNKVLELYRKATI